jgi:hypothetical protein
MRATQDIIDEVVTRVMRSDKGVLTSEILREEARRDLGEDPSLEAERNWWASLALALAIIAASHEARK